MSRHNSRELLTRLKGYSNELPIYIDADEVSTEVYYYENASSLYLWGGDHKIDTVGDLRVWLINRPKPEQTIWFVGVNDWRKIDEIELYKDGLRIEFY